MAIILSLAIVFPTLFSVSAAEIISNTDYDNLPSKIFDVEKEFVDQKTYCKMTIDNDFDDRTVLVVLNKEKSNEKDTFTPKDFPEIDVVEIICLSSGTKELIKRQQLALQRLGTSAKKLTERSRSVANWETEKKALPDELMDCDRRGLYLVDTERFRQILSIKLKTPGKENVLKAVKLLEQREDVLSAEPSGYGKSESIPPNDPNFQYGSQWGLTQIQAPSAWDTTTGAATVTVGVLDSGIDRNHPDLANRVNVALSRDFVGDGLSPNGLADPCGHGTHVAGIIGAEGNNGIGIAGVCWDVRLVSFRMIDANGSYNLDWLVAAINAAQAARLRIINHSGGFYGNYNAVQTAVNNFDGLMVFAAMNEGTNNDTTPVYPASYDNDNIISVGASDYSDEMASFSNYGQTSVDLFAPGVGIYSTVPTSYASMSGTSMAAPHVAGVAALLLSVKPDLTVNQLRIAILNGATKVPALKGFCWTGGRLNALESLNIFGDYHVTYIANKTLYRPKYHDHPLTLIQDDPYIWNPDITKYHTISFNNPYGSATPNKVVVCTLEKWNTVDGISYSPGALYTANASVTLFAVWNNPIAGTLPVPSRTGYRFVGWYDAPFNGTMITESTVLTGDITVYAQWMVNSYNINLNQDDATVNGATSHYATYGYVPPQIRSLPSRTNYIFDGYWTALSGGVQVFDSNGNVLPNVANYTGANGVWIRDSGETFYARWKPKPFYDITYDANGGVGAPDPQIKIFGQPLTLSNTAACPSELHFPRMVNK